MSPVARSPGGRLKSLVGSRLRSVTDLALVGHTDREREILRQLTDVFRELERLSALQSSIDETNAGIERLVRAVETDIDVHVETTQLLGRLLESTRARLEVLEEAVNGPK